MSKLVKFPADRSRLVPFNMNSYVWVQLTDVGRKMLQAKERVRAINLKGSAFEVEASKPCYEVTMAGWFRFRMHDFCALFGGHFTGPQTSVYTNILIEP